MWTKLIISAVVAVFVAASSVIAVGTSPVTRSTVNTATIPQSQLSSGLIKSPNPMSTNGNLIITGNVADGKHFRGVVPYNAISDFGGPLRSTALDPFLRDSGGYGYSGRYSGSLTPFYSQTRTVTTTSPGLATVVNPLVPRVTGYRAVDYSVGLSSRPKTSPVYGSAYSGYESGQIQSNPVFLSTARPMSRNTIELERVMANKVQSYTGISQAQVEKEKQDISKLQKSLKKIGHEADLLEQSITYTDLRTDIGRDSLSSDLTLPLQPELAKETPRTEIAQLLPPDVETLQQKTDVFDIMKSQLESLIADLATKAADKQAKAASPEDAETQKTHAERIAELELASTRAKAVLGKHKTFASYAEDKFNQHIRAAEDYMKEGKYYWAANAYTVASAYKPEDPLAFAGKSHALLLAGEYMSSALFLERAIGLFPEYAWIRIDLETMVADKDKIENRIIDIREWIENSNAPELKFLLAYVYHQLDRVEWAYRLIKDANEKMPDSKAVATLKKAIEETLANLEY